MKEFLLANALWLLCAYAGVNLVTFALYGIDKRKAQRGKWRISEACLLGFAFCFGALGALLGMRVFRHKTKHAKFMILVPLFLVLQLAAVIAALVL